jgi:hypothetical protein
MFFGALASGLLAAPRLVEAQMPRAVPSGTSGPWLVVLPFLLAGVVALLCATVVVLVSRRRRGRKAARILVTLGAGSVCGALWMLLVDTVANTVSIDTISESAVLLVGVVTALVAVLLLSAPTSLREVAGLSMMVIGFHSLALPVAALSAFVVAGAAWLPGASAELRAVGLSVAGLLVGILLIFLGDQVLRPRRTRRSRPRLDLSGPRVRRRGSERG